MKPEDALELAREGSLDALGAEREAVANAVRDFVAAGDPASALELVGRSWRIWFSRGELEEGSAVAAAALGAVGTGAAPIWRVRTLYADGLFAFRSGDQQRSLARNEEALRVARDIDDVRGECDALTGLARAALREGKYDDVVNLAREARGRARAVGDRESEASPLHLQAAGVRLRGEYAGARALYLESLDLNAALGRADSVEMEQQNLGWVELHLGNTDEAEGRFREGFARAVDDAFAIAFSNLAWAAIAAQRGNFEEAKQRFAEGRQAVEDLGVALDPDDQSELDWLSELLVPPPGGSRTKEP
jgi:tetratricopeptide (TPR) repeat protein